MTNEEAFARKYGPALSAAQHMHETGYSLEVGQTWNVSVVVVSGEPADLALEVGVYPFSFETFVTTDLLLAAERLVEWMLQRKQAAPHLPLWNVVEGRMILYVRIHPPTSVILKADLRASISRLDTVERAIRNCPADVWILYYLEKNWFHHIPSNESQDYYRGETHGFRLTLASMDTLYAADDSETMTVLGVVHIFLAGVSAKLYFELYPELALPAAHEWENAMPRAGCLHRLDPFQIGPEEAAVLATSIDPAIAKMLSRMSPGALDVLRPYQHVIPSNDTSDFYRGLTHSLQLSVRSIRLFAQLPLVDNAPRLPPTLESGTAQMSYVAAQTWLAQRRVRPN